MQSHERVWTPQERSAVARLRNVFPPPAPGHHCNVLGECRGAQSEGALGRHGKLPHAGTAGLEHVFLLPCRAIHVCTEIGCEYWGQDPTHTCPISGIQWGAAVESSYNRHDSRTWYARSPNQPTPATPFAAIPKIPKSGEKSDEVKKERASSLLKLLIWSNKRVARNAQSKQQQMEACKLARANYIQAQAAQHQFPYATDLYRIEAHLLYCEPPLQILEWNEALHDYYVALLVQVWDRIQHFYVRAADKIHDVSTSNEVLPRLDLDSVILATLYGMRQGYHQQGVTILPQDEFLNQNLPLIGDLFTYFGLPKNAITKGQKILRRAFDNAFLDNVPTHMIELNTNALAKERDALAPPKAEEIVEDERGEKVKITSNGERLFMCSVRPKFSDKKK